MEQCRIVSASLALVFLACAGNGESQDAGGGTPDTGDDGNSLVIPLPPYEVSPTPDVPRCTCDTWLSPCPGDAAACVGCQGSSAYCDECPVPSVELRPCTTLGLHCGYGQTICDCIVRDSGEPVWYCVTYLY
jgi:hypothetical protein